MSKQVKNGIRASEKVFRAVLEREREREREI